MNPAKAGRTAKVQRVCHDCRKPCLPKNGDWFTLPKDKGNQIFLCKECERLRPALRSREAAVG